MMFADPDKIQLWSVYLANAACVLLGILAGVIVYGVLVIALRILRAEDESFGRDTIAVVLCKSIIHCHKS